MYVVATKTEHWNHKVKSKQNHINPPNFNYIAFTKFPILPTQWSKWAKKSQKRLHMKLDNVGFSENVSNFFIWI